MKAIRLIVLNLVILFLASVIPLRSQTYQYEWRSDFNGSEGWCINHALEGYMIYHVTIHVDQKTGTINRIHNNVKQYDLIDLVTGEKLVVIDTGNDQLGWWWAWWNDVTGAGLPLPQDGNWPDEGIAIASAFKFISKGGNVYHLRLIYQLRRNAAGEIKVENYKEISDCD
jgi:hypothetical protein